MVQFLLDQAKSWASLVTGKATEIEWSRSLFISLTDQFLWAIFLVFLYMGYRKIQLISNKLAWIKLIGIVCLIATMHALVSRFTFLVLYKCKISHYLSRRRQILMANYTKLIAIIIQPLKLHL